MQFNRFNPFRYAFLFISLSLAGSGDALLAQVTYQIVQPEVQGQAITQVQSYGNHINETGATLLNRTATFAVWQDGKVTHIVNARPSASSERLVRLTAADVNRFGQVVGSRYITRIEADTYQSVTSPFYWDASNGLIELAELFDDEEFSSRTTQLLSINDLGQAAGLRIDNASGSLQAFTWSFDNGATRLPVLNEINGYSVTRPNAINANGSIAGTYYQFEGNADTYYERPFLYTAENGMLDLAELSPQNFETGHASAEDVNAQMVVVGNRNNSAYCFDTVHGEFHLISGDTLTRANSINDRNVIVGSYEILNPGSASGFAPFLWTAQSGRIDLFGQLRDDLQQILPEGSQAETARISPKSINAHGQISASLTANGFAREIVLEPVIEAGWSNMEPSERDGVKGIAYTLLKTGQAGSIPASDLGLQIGFEVSSDLSNWQTATTQQHGVVIEEKADRFELWLPLGTDLYLRPTLSASGQAQSVQ